MLKDIPAELYHDETVSFIADRYHTTTQHIIASFLMQKPTDKNPSFWKKTKWRY